jgi:hypothetical protein
MQLRETENSYIIEGMVQCAECKGTGLYQGMAEHDGAAVVCYSCCGQGCKLVTLKFEKFTEREILEGVKRVYHTAGGYGISAKDVTTREGKLIRFSEFGCAYEEWLEGVAPKPIEDLHCPYQLGFGRLDNCKLRDSMDVCWKRYHELVASQKEG